MTFPAAADFNSDQPYAAWWGYTRGPGAADVCATTAAAAVYAVRRGVGLYGWNWDAELQAALIAKATELARARPAEAWGPVVAALQADATRRAASGLALAFGLWLAFYQPNGLRFDGVAVPAGTILPPWDDDAPGDPGAETVCWREGVDLRPEVLNAAQLRAAVAASRYGLRLRDGEAPPGPYVPPPPPPPGLEGAQIALAGAGVLAVGLGLAWLVNRGAAR